MAYTFGITGGTLPTGLTLSTAGVLSGTPTALGTFSFTVTVTDSVGGTASQTYNNVQTVAAPGGGPGSMLLLGVGR
jgi:large repetitive protein